MNDPKPPRHQYTPSTSPSASIRTLHRAVHSGSLGDAFCRRQHQRDNISAGVGVIHKRNLLQVRPYAHNLEEAEADMILLACSTFNSGRAGPPMIDIPSCRFDRAHVELAVRQGTRVVYAGDAGHPGSLLRAPAAIVAAEQKKRGNHHRAAREAFRAFKKGDAGTHNAMLPGKRSTSSPGRWMSSSWSQLSMSALAPQF